MTCPRASRAQCESNLQPQGFPNDLKFEPRNEKEPIFLNTLPEEELRVPMISELDTTSIERFAGVGRRVRVPDPGYGGIYFHISLSIVADFFCLRDLVRATYKPPQILDLELLRIRLDGVYIAICYYVFVLLLYQNADFPTLTLLSHRRPGLSKNTG